MKRGELRYDKAARLLDIAQAASIALSTQRNYLPRMEMRQFAGWYFASLGSN